jgi:hypothetical protein
MLLRMTALAALFFPLWALPAAAAPIAFVDVTVVAVESGRAVPGQVVVVEGDRIVREGR